MQINVLKQTIALELDERAGRVEVSAAEIGMAVRIEEDPNAALEETLSDVLGRPATTEPTEPAERPAGQPVRRGGRPPRGGGRAATPADGGSDAPADAATAAGEERPGRRRRRRGRRRGRGASADATTGMNSVSVDASHNGTCRSDQFMATWPRMPEPNAMTTSQNQLSPVGQDRSWPNSAASGRLISPT